MKSSSYLPSKKEKELEIEILNILAEGYYERYREKTLDEYIERLEQDIAIINWSYMLMKLEKGSFSYPDSIMDYYFGRLGLRIGHEE